jgi:hypothetical protein
VFCTRHAFRKRIERVSISGVVVLGQVLATNEDIDFERVSISGVWFRAGPIGLATNEKSNSNEFRFPVCGSGQVRSDLQRIKISISNVAN